MTKSKLVNKILKEIRKKYDVKVYAEEEEFVTYIVIDNKKVFDSSSYAEFIFNNSMGDKETGKFINFLYEVKK